MTGECEEPREESTLKPKLPPRARQTGRRRGAAQKTWKFLCLFMSLTLMFVALILITVPPKIFQAVQQMQEEMARMKTQVTRGLADAAHDRDFIRGEMFRQLSGNGSCAPCAPGWTAFQGSCYNVSSDAVSWHWAEESCVRKRARLVVINSRAEQEFLTSLVNTTAWIGLLTRGGEGPPRWLDGAVPTYTNWDPRQPREDPAPACVVMLQPGRWSRAPCDAASAYTCESRQSC